MLEQVRSGCSRSLADWKWGAAAALLACLMTGAAYLGAAYKSLPVHVFLTDPNYLANQPFYYGTFELASVLIMWCAATVLLFSVWFLSGPKRAFVALSGILSAELALDDLYMFHEHMHDFHLPEGVVYVSYAILLLVILIPYRRVVMQTPMLILGAALFFYLLSAVLDAGYLGGSEISDAEGIAELFAVSLWATYLIRTSHLFATEALVQRAAG